MLFASTANRTKLEDPAEHFDTLALDILTVKAAVEYIQTKFFEGHRVLWKPFDDELDRYVKILADLVSFHADWDSKSWLLDLMELCFQPEEPGNHRRSSKLDLDGLERSIDPSKRAESLIVEAKAKVLSGMGNYQAARELLSPMLRGMEVSNTKCPNGPRDENQWSLKHLRAALKIKRVRVPHP